MFKFFAFLLLIVFSLNANPREALESLGMVEITKVSEVPEDFQITMVMKVVIIKEQVIDAKGMYAGKKWVPLEQPLNMAVII